VDKDILHILEKGVDAWNSWRQMNPLDIPNLVRAELSGANLFRANLQAAHLHRANLNGADLRRANLNGADLRRASLVGANLAGAHLSAALLTGASLAGAHLAGAHLSRADLRYTDLTRANLTHADLTRANLTDANLAYANLSAANLDNASLTGADLSGANLIQANLNHALLDEMDLTAATIGWTSLGDLDLRSVLGLDTVFHRGPSTLGVDTLALSRGGVPEEFLRGVGVPEEWIAPIHSLAGGVTEPFAHFIRYAPEDETFAKRLCTDLQAKSLRCWRAPIESLMKETPSWDTEPPTCSRSRFLVVLSRHSVQSDQLQREVAVALAEKQREHDERPHTLPEKETCQRRSRLFPLRLDETVLSADVEWVAHLSRQVPLLDFSHWEEPDAYYAAFDRLLRALQS